MIYFSIDYVIFLCSNNVEQVVQYYCWKASDLEDTKVEAESSKVVLLSESKQQRISILRSLFAKDDQLASTVFGRPACGESKHRHFNWAKFFATIAMWEDYARMSYEGILKSLPLWRAQEAIFNISFDEKLPVIFILCRLNKCD